MLELVLSNDPGLIRRLGHTLPVEIVPLENTPAVAAAIDHLEGSPLFEIGWGFQLLVGEHEVVLALSDGSELFRGRVGAGPRDSESLGRRIAKAAHEELFIPNVDITQADVRSLDGGLGGGGRAAERTRSVLDEVLNEPR
jgi:hypothetical protein